MGIFMWFKIAKNKKIPWAILKIPGNAHSPFCPDLADFSACVPPALQNGPGNFFVFCNFESLKHSHNKLWSRNLLHFFSFWATLANLGELQYYKYIYSIMFFTERIITIPRQIYLHRSPLVMYILACFFLNTKSLNFFGWKICSST